jgi:SET domain-containing protein
MNSKYSRDFHIVEDAEGKGAGLFASRMFRAGDDIYVLDYWSEERMPLHATNHSCDPNSAFDDAGMLVVLREIAKGEEITYDYLEHPIPASPWNFKCLCGSGNCRGWINAS